MTARLDITDNPGPCIAPPTSGLVVAIDPEDRDDVDRLCALYVARTDGLPWVDRSHMQRAAVLDDMQAALRGLVASPLPDVFSHLVVDKDDATKESLCGKVWRPTADVNVVGKCPDCLSIVNDEEWVA